MLDAAKGYWKVRLTDHAREYSAFTTPFGHYEFIIMPFGVKGGPCTFQRAINGILEGMDEFATAFIDDVALFTQGTWEDHMEKLQAVLSRLVTHNLTLKANKWRIGGPRSDIWAMKWGQAKLLPCLPKWMRNLVCPPQRQKSVFIGVLGAVRFYRHFIPRFAVIPIPLTNLLRGGG